MHKMLTSEQVRTHLLTQGIEPSSLEKGQLIELVADVEPLITQMHPAVIQEFLSNVQTPILSMHEIQHVA